MSNLMSVIDAMASLPTEALTDSDIEDTIVEVHRAEAKLASLKARLVADAEARRFFEIVGFGSTAAWLRARLNIPHGVARALVTLGRGLRDCIGAARALADGDIDATRARILIQARASHADVYATSEDVLVDAAHRLNPRDFRMAVEYWSEAADPERFGADQEARFARRSINVSATYDGMTRVDGWLDPESGAVVHAVLEAYADVAGRTDDDHRSRAQARADALTDICRFSLEHAKVPTTGGFRPQVTLIADLQMLEGRAGYRAEIDAASGRVTGSAARRIACDAGVSRVITDGRSEPLDVGRANRTATPAQRKALATRDGGCVMDGCDMPVKYTDAHHIVHWIDGGRTDLANQCLLCRRHHKGVHEGTFELPERFRLADP